MEITLEQVNEEFSRSVMAESVVLPIDKWVKYLNLAQFALTHIESSSQAEIARLQAEVDEWRAYGKDKAEQLVVSQSQNDTAWNDAIEAAECHAYEWAEKNARNKNKYVDLRNAILSLKRT